MLSKKTFVFSWNFCRKKRYTWEQVDYFRIYVIKVISELQCNQNSIFCCKYIENFFNEQIISVSPTEKFSLSYFISSKFSSKLLFIRNVQNILQKYPTIRFFKWKPV